MVAEAIRGRATTLAAGGFLTAGEVIRGPETTPAAGGHPMVAEDIRAQAITLAGATARTEAAGFREQVVISVAAGIPMGGGLATISAAGGNNRSLTNTRETT